MDKLFKIFVCILFIVVATLSCSNSDDNGIDNPNNNNEIVPEGVDTYGYIKDTDGNPISGVVVSDGFNFSVTDNTGLYKFNRDKSSRHVRYSLPSEYEAELHSSYKLPQLYAKLQSNTAKYNFTLRKLSAPETRFDLITIGDPQVKTTDHIERFRVEAVADIHEYVANADVPCYGITLGDHVGNKWDLFSNLILTMRSDVAGLSIFPTVGNHDYEFPKSTEVESLAQYENYFGPTDYSFNRGNAHIVSVNNVLHTYTASDQYDGGLSDARFEWLKKDLSYVSKDKMVILCLHIPIRNSNHKYYSEVLDLLSEFKSASIMSAHTHTNYKYIHTINGKEIVEHVTGTTCGAWWTSTVCSEGTPNGFGVFQIDGAEIKNWIYKAVRHDADFQIRLYRASEIFTGGAAVSYQFAYKDNGQIIANIWNWDEKWTVDVYENDIKTGSMTRFTGADAWVGAYHVGVLNTSYSSNTNHLFYYTLKNPDAVVKVVATDRFGTEYEQSVFTDPTSHPGVFHSDY